MSLNYQGDKNHHDHGNQWTSYSDLFMGLSVIFLLLYVTSSLRTGTNGLQQQLEREKLTHEVRDLKAQLQVYNTLRKDYMDTDATNQDVEVYKELMDKLSLLQEDAKDEKEALLNQALENEKKEKALNQYQQMVRNIVNANMVAKGRIKKRDDVIKELDQDVTEQDQEIDQLESTVEQKRRQLVESQKQIEKAEAELDKKKQDLRSAFRNQEISKKKFEKQLAELEQENSQKLNNLKSKAQQAEQQLQSVSGKLANVSKELDTVQGALASKEAEAKALEGRIQGLKSDYAQRAAAEKAKFDKEMAAARLSAAEKARREAEFRASAAEKEKQLASQVNNLSGKLGDTEKQLAKAKAEIEAKRSVSKDIKEAFRKAGVKADIDEETGDVILDFGENYFATGSSKLNGEMTRVLEKAVPLYTKALFENDKVAKKLGSVEIIGFASPTYKGKYLNPDELNKVDKKAIDYNLDLSYKRAKAIFNHIFDQSKMQYDHQRQLQPLVKVSGRSFFSESKNARGPGLKTDSCSKGDCSKAQKVIIKYTLDY